MPILDVKSVVKIKVKNKATKEVHKEKILIKRALEVTQDSIDDLGFMPALRKVIKDLAKERIMDTFLTVDGELDREVVAVSIEYNTWRTAQ